MIDIALISKVVCKGQSFQPDNIVGTSSMEPRQEYTIV